MQNNKEYHFLKGRPKKGIQHLTVGCLRKWETNQVVGCIEEKDKGRKRGEIFSLIRT